MPGATISKVRLAGVAAAVPALRTVEWDELGIPADRFRRSRTDRRRPVLRAAKREQCQSDFCQSAAETLLRDLGWAPAEIDIIVFVTLTPDYPIPATAIIMQDRLGLPKTTIAFDLPGGSASLFHGMQLVTSMLSTGHLRRALLLCGEVSKTEEGPDHIESVEHLCGHNGSVLAFEHAPDAEPMCFESGGDGAAFREFYMPVGGTRCPPQPEMFSPERLDAFDNPAMRYSLNQTALQAAARRELPGAVRAVIARAGATIAEVDFCFVQAMGLDAEEALRAELGMRKDRFHGLAYEYGYAGSGGVVLALLARAASRLERERATLVFTGLGAGLAWGSALLRTERLVCPDIIEIA